MRTLTGPKILFYLFGSDIGGQPYDTSSERYQYRTGERFPPFRNVDSASTKQIGERRLYEHTSMESGMVSHGYGDLLKPIHQHHLRIYSDVSEVF